MTLTSFASTMNAAEPNPPRPPRNRRPKQRKESETPSSGPSSEQKKRNPKFNATLTKGESSGSVPPKSKRPNSKSSTIKLPDGEDLTSTLIRNLSTAPYPDCPVCFTAITRNQPTWSCSPLIEILPNSAEQSAEYCWTTFHLLCIQQWAEKSFKESQDAWTLRGEPDRASWRCPSCQGHRKSLVDVYRCFCGSTENPKSRLGIPHSCGNSCSRQRSACEHPCSLQCHPGPCPPCKITLQVVCGCPKAKRMDRRCSDDTSSSCGETCLRPLPCGNPDHLCNETCHLGPCLPCNKREVVKCWCRKAERETTCGEIAPILHQDIGCGTVTAQAELKGFTCDQVCGRPFSCGSHTCEKLCHPPADSPSLCPYSPELVITCPCGKTPIVDVRTTCAAPIPTCNQTCMKELSGCDHLCRVRCHLGGCPPCVEEIQRSCRCGLTKKSMVCGSSTTTEILCTKPCPALRSCGRHQCNRLCCPLASLGAIKGKGKKGVISASDLEPGLHLCDLVCGKPLTCGQHHCEERDHRGPCGPCLRSSFEELICSCGRTVMEPPIPCGTQISCSYPCTRDPPPCGHPRATHSCHPETVGCPLCPFLTKRLCACGKKEIPNVKCSLDRDKVRCGSACGKLLPCGFHRCERSCHPGDCGLCTSICGKSRRLCHPLQHPCSLTCHAPAICPEETPCQSVISLSCSCGRITKSVPCNRSLLNPTGRSESQQQLECTSECAIAQRNARLADALGIDTEVRNRNPFNRVEFSDNLVTFAKHNVKFMLAVEKSFNDFVNLGRKSSEVLPQMPLERRQFVVELATAYRMDTQIVDQQPHQSVQLWRRIDTRVPNPTLSAYVSSMSSHLNLNKLKAPSPPKAPAKAWSVPNPAVTASAKEKRPPQSSVPPAVTTLDAAVPLDWEDEINS